MSRAKRALASPEAGADDIEKRLREILKSYIQYGADDWAKHSFWEAMETQILKLLETERERVLKLVVDRLPKKKNLPKQGNFTRLAWQKYDTDNGYNIAIDHTLKVIERLRSKK